MDSSSPRSGSRGGNSLEGLLATLEISAAAIAIGSAIGLGVGVGLVFAPRPLRLLLRAYVDLVRGTPVLVLILASFYILAVVGLQLGAPRPASSRCRCSAAPISARSCAARCRRYRSTQIESAPQPRPRQLEAPRSSCCCRRRCGRSIPIWVNTATEIVKASTLLSVIGVGELLLKTQEIIGRNYLTLEFYVLAGRLLPDQLRHRAPRQGAERRFALR